MVDFYNSKNWKKTHAKSYDAWICMPPVGTYFYNEAIGMEQITDAVNKYIICYPNGFKTMCDLAYIEKTFVEPHECYSINAEYLARKQGGFQIISWFKVWSHTPGERLAIHIPCNRKENLNLEIGSFIANASGIDHGDGDYVICPIINESTPDLRWPVVVNGLLFPHLFALNNIHLSMRMKHYLKTSKISEPKEVVAPLYCMQFPATIASWLNNAGIRIEDIKTNAKPQIYNSPFEVYWWTFVFKHNKDCELKIKNDINGFQSAFACSSNTQLSFLSREQDPAKLAKEIIQRMMNK